MHSLCASVTAVYLSFFVFGRVLTRLDFSYLRKFGLCMHVGRGNAASKTEAMYFPPPRMAYEAADTSRFYIDGTGFIDFCETSE